MTLRHPAAASLAGLLALAGCLGAPAPAPVPGEAAQAMPTWLDLGPCEEQFAFLPVARAAAEARLPEGFALLTLDALGQAAVVAAVGFRCAEATGEGLWLGEVRGLGFVLAVVPPEAYREEGVQYYVLPLAGFTDSEDLASVVGGWRFPDVQVGAMAFDLAARDPPVRSGRVAFGDQAELTVASVGAEEPQAAERFRVFALEEGKVVGAIDWSWTDGRALENGTAALRLGPGLDAVPPPVAGGLGYQYWGDYNYRLRWVAFA